MMLSLLLSLNAHSHIFRNAEISSKKICRCRRRNSMAYQQCGSSKCKILATVVAMCNYRVSLIIFAITLSSASQFCGHVVIAMAADCITNVNFGFKPLATELGIYAAKNNLCPWIIFLPRDAMQSAVMRLYNVCLFVTLRYVKKIDWRWTTLWQKLSGLLFWPTLYRHSCMLILMALHNLLTTKDLFTWTDALCDTWHYWSVFDESHQVFSMSL